MIEFTIKNNGTLGIVQRDFSPTVYLDHWALRYFSENPSLTDQFSKVLKLRNGTLALSWLNMVEFTKVTMEEQTRKAEILIEKIIPQIFFIEIDPFTVISREDDLLAGGHPVPPHADPDLLKAFVQLKPTSLKLFTSHDLFKVIQDSHLGTRLDSFTDTGIERIEALRDKFDTNEEFKLAVQRLPSGPQLQRGTRFILRELVRPFLIDKQIKVTRNQVVDLYHAVVPVSYCEFVLLDKHWETQVDRVRSRLKAAGISVPVGKIFSGKGNGIDQFLNKLESS